MARNPNSDRRRARQQAPGAGSGEAPPAVHAVAARRPNARPPRGAAGSVLLAVALLGVLGTLTWRQAALYRDGITFFRYVVAQTRGHARRT